MRTYNFKHSFRAMYKQKAYLFINIVGLSIGIACSMIIALFIINELSYDQFNEKKDRIYRLIVNGKMADKELSYAITSGAIGPAMLRDFPEVEAFMRLTPNGESLVKYSEKIFPESSLVYADSTFFKVFSIPLLRGNVNTVLNSGHTLVLSQATAVKIFGDKDPIDKLIRIEDDTIPFLVTGIMADIPGNSHFNANIIASFMTYFTADDNWNDNRYVTYLLLKKNALPSAVNAKIPAMIIKYLGPAIKKSFGITMEEFIAKNNYNIYLQPLGKIHLNPSITQFTKLPANPKYLFIFGGIALLILLIAVFNYMNLSTAQASRRAKEVGIKKLSGSSRSKLIWQFLGESLFLSFVSLGFAIIIVENSLPFFGRLLNTELQISYFGNWFTLPVLFILSVIIGMLAGSYPAFLLSSFNPYLVLKGKVNESLKSGSMRKLLVVLQFSISIILIVGTIIMFRQIRFMLKKDLGFNKEQLMVISRAGVIGNRVSPFKEAISKIPDVLHISASTAVPGRSESGTSYIVEGKPGDLFEFKINYVDYDFLETYGIKLAAGRSFNDSYPSDKTAAIINETAIRQLNIPSPIGLSLIDGQKKFPIIGVVKDFHYESMRAEISPYVLRFKTENDNYGYFSLRLSKNASSVSIREVENIWKKFAPETPMQYYFLDQDFDQKYKEEKQNSRLAILFTILAIFIAGLGLFGLTSISIEQRTKEIGIRKTMGATPAEIIFILSKEFVMIVSIATIIAWPIIFLLAKNWLQNYYYRINLKAVDFIAGLLIAVLITIIVIGYHTIKSSRSNPVDALRYE